MSLSEVTLAGLRDMPSNAAWLLSRALKPAEVLGSAAESATSGARDRGRKVAAAVVDAAPLGGDSIEIRMRRAQEAGERARTAEERAVEAAQQSKARSDHAREVIERGRAQVKEVERESARQAKQRVAETQKAADQWVKEESRAAEAEAEEQRRQVRSEVDSQVEEVQRDADACQRQAEELIEDAAEKRAEARRLATEAAQAARVAAEEANRQAQHLAHEAEQQVGEATDRVKATEQLRERAQAGARRSTREPARNSANGDLQSYNKAELVKLASSVGVEQRSTMTKRELVHAIGVASRAKRQPRG